jgi:poly(3-hydroxybutyrate) depolymerase
LCAVLFASSAISAACTDTASELSGAPRGGSSGSSGESSSGGADDADAGTPRTTGDDAGSKPTPDGGDGGDGGAGSSNGKDKPNCKYTAHETGLTSLQQAGGLAFTTYVPASYDANVGHAVVFIMHGQDSNGVPELQALWQGLADQESLILVAPKGSRPATNGSASGANWAVADLNHVLDLVTEIDDCYNVLTKKHILWGFSEGAFYGYLLGIGGADAFSGLAMGGANTSFARQNGFPPASAPWKIPVSHVHGDQDFNPISATRQDKADFEAAGHVFTLHEHTGGHTITASQVKMQYEDLETSVSP